MVNDEFKQFMVFFSIVLIIIIVFSYLMFGLAGVRVVLGIVFVSLPFYLILNKFGLTEGEKAVFSVLMGLTLFPSLAYIFGLVASFKLGIMASFMAFVVAAVLLKYKAE